MSDGLRVWGSNGNVELDTGDRITRLVFHKVVSSGSSGSTTVDGFGAGQQMVVAYPVSTALHRIAHQVSVSGDTISWSPANTGDNDLANPSDSVIMAFMYG